MDDVKAHQPEALNVQYYDKPMSVCRFDDPDSNGEWIVVKFEGGGQMSIYTTTPLMWVDPEEH